MALVQARFFFFDLISAASCRAASVATRPEDPVGGILHANGFRYEIENLFRVTKSEFDARPVYLRLEDRIRSHFAICFVALLLKAFQRQVNEGLDEGSRYSSEQIINALAGMDYNVVRGTCYVPAYSAVSAMSTVCSVPLAYLFGK